MPWNKRPKFNEHSLSDIPEDKINETVYKILLVYLQTGIYDETTNGRPFTQVSTQQQK